MFSESAIRRRSSFQATYFPVETWRGNKNARIEGRVCACVQSMANDSRGQNRRRMGSEKGAAKNQYRRPWNFLSARFPITKHRVTWSMWKEKKNKTFRFDHFLEFSWIVVTIFRITRWAPRTTRGCQVYIAENFPPQTLFSTFSFHLLKDLQNCKLLLLLLF